jgi:hypothetical protein
MIMLDRFIKLDIVKREGKMKVILGFIMLAAGTMAILIMLARILSCAWWNGLIVWGIFVLGFLGVYLITEEKEIK